MYLGDPLEMGGCGLIAKKLARFQLELCAVFGTDDTDYTDGMNGSLGTSFA